jgi:hypothetical protein
MSITFNNLLSGNIISDVPLSHQHNLEDLLKRINLVGDIWGQPMTVTSGYRTMQHHLAIYAKKGITDKSKIPMQSRHLYGMAVDILDEDGKLHHWLQNDPIGITILEKAELWCENRQGPWQHFQIVPPKSGSRWFNP